MQESKHINCSRFFKKAASYFGYCKSRQTASDKCHDMPEPIHISTSRVQYQINSTQHHAMQPKTLTQVDSGYQSTSSVDIYAALCDNYALFGQNGMGIHAIRRKLQNEDANITYLTEEQAAKLKDTIYVDPLLSHDNDFWVSTQSLECMHHKLEASFNKCDECFADDQVADMSHTSGDPIFFQSSFQRRIYMDIQTRQDSVDACNYKSVYSRKSKRTKILRRWWKSNPKHD
ncbi:hypothetical protein RTP6_006797 [Batrachochytrium dendrobatidis]